MDLLNVLNFCLYLLYHISRNRSETNTELFQEYEASLEDILKFLL